MTKLVSPLLAFPALVLLVGLSACSSKAPPGVLPRTDVPPPPSLSGETRRSATPASRPTTSRRQVTVPDRLETPAPSASQNVTPVMTGSGIGAGFKF